MFRTAIQESCSTVARDAFWRVVNLRTLAILFYVCLAWVLPWRMLSMVEQGIGTWIFETAFYLRQTLVSGAWTMAAIAVAAVLLEARRRHGPVDTKQAAFIFVPLIALAELLGLITRVSLSTLQWSSLLGENWSFLAFNWMNWTLIGTTGAAVYWFKREADLSHAYAYQRRVEQSSLEAQMVEARLAALQAQIEPHFLFNTLATVRRLYETEPSKGELMLSSLVAYLRAALPSMRMKTSTVACELDLARNYLTILGIRMGDRLRFSIDAEDAALTAAFPPLMLATLLENAIKHGLSPLPEGGEIAIRACVRSDRLSVEVADNGAGFSGESGSGVGLANTRARLAALYGRRAQLRLAENQPRGVLAAVELPWEHAA